ncbi:uncharacterized protein J3R85_012671 [Psidium guajava]|nr:uncharacterized protein J3R85_012671 [Psidium guajava]
MPWITQASLSHITGTSNNRHGDQDRDGQREVKPMVREGRRHGHSSEGRTREAKRPRVILNLMRRGERVEKAS